MHRVLLSFLVFTMSSSVRANKSGDVYLEETQHQCLSEKIALSCAKFTVLSYATNLGREYAEGLTGNGSVARLIRLERRHENESQLFPTARQLPADNELTKFFKFVKRQINDYMETQGLAISLPEGAQIIEDATSNSIDEVVEEGRGKKKKAAMVLLPLIILFKLFKVKIMLALVLASVIFIKKAIMLGALILPTILQHVKHCSASGQHHHYTPYHIADDHHHHEHADDYGGYANQRAYQAAYQAYYKKQRK